MGEIQLKTLSNKKIKLKPCNNKRQCNCKPYISETRLADIMYAMKLHFVLLFH